MYQRQTQDELSITSHSQPYDRFGQLDHFSVIPQPRQTILQRQSLEISEEQIFLSNNPFIPIKTCTNAVNIRCLLIFSSRNQISSIEITSLSGIQKKIKVVTSIQKYIDGYLAIAYFQLNQSREYSCCVNYPDFSLTRHRFLKEQNQNLQKTKLLIIPNNNIHPSLLNYALFQTIQFLLQKIIQDSLLIQRQLFPWLRILYDHYKITDKQTVQQILKKLQIRKDAIKYGQYFIYFFYSIFRQKSLQLYQSCNLKTKILYKFTCRIMNKNYPKSQQLSNFYLQLNLIYAISNKNIYDEAEIKNLINFNLGCQSADKRYQLLMRVGISSPKYLVQYDLDVKRIFEQSKTLSAVQFFKLTIAYFPYLLQQRQLLQQQNYLKAFINNLIQLSKRRKPSKDIKINDIQINNLFYSGYGNEKTLRIAITQIPKYYSKCKILDHLSKHSINLMENAKEMMRSHLKILLKNIKIKTILSLLILPTNSFDKIQLNALFNKKQIKTEELSQILQQIIGNKVNQFDIGYLQQRFQQIDPQIQINKIAQSLDKILYLQKNSNQIDNSKLFLINRIFMISTSQIKIDNCNTLQKMLNSCAKIKDNLLKQAFISKIFNKIRGNRDFLDYAQKSIAIYQRQFREKCTIYLAICRIR